MSEGGKEAVRADDAVVAASEFRRLEERVRELERLLGRKTMEVEILKEALDLARQKNNIAVALAASGRYPVKTGVWRARMSLSVAIAKDRSADRSNAPAMSSWPM